MSKQFRMLDMCWTCPTWVEHPTWLYKKLLVYIQSYSPCSEAQGKNTHVGHVQQMSNIVQQTTGARQ